MNCWGPVAKRWGGRASGRIGTEPVLQNIQSEQFVEAAVHSEHYTKNKRCTPNTARRGVGILRDAEAQRNRGPIAERWGGREAAGGGRGPQSGRTRLGGGSAARPSGNTVELGLIWGHTPRHMAEETPTRRSPLTVAVHGGEPRSYPHDALTAPIVQTATYSFAETAELVAYFEGRKQREEYGRYGNPTVRLVEDKVAALEGTEAAAAFTSGMSAVTSAILGLVKAGSHVVLFADCYRRTRQFVTTLLERFGVTHTLVPPTDLAALEQALTPDTRLVVSELPTNPYQTVVDLERLGALCRARRVKTLIDSTFATPINLRPAEWGIDLIVHSATKYLAGHNDVLGGVLAGKRGLVSLVRELRDVVGGVLDPHAAYLIHRGMKTLPLRVAQQNATALRLAQALEQHPRISRVWYPGLESHPHHDVAKRLMDGFGGVVTFEVDADLDGTSAFIDGCKIPRIAPSLGGVESLIEQPALMSFFELTTEQREAVGIKDNLVRYAVGIEDADDLTRDILQAL